MPRTDVKIKHKKGNVSTIRYDKPQTRRCLQADRRMACSDSGNRRVALKSHRVHNNNTKQQFVCEKRPHHKGESELAYEKRMIRNSQARTNYYRRRYESLTAKQQKEMTAMVEAFRAQNRKE